MTTTYGITSITVTRLVPKRRRSGRRPNVSDEWADWRYAYQGKERYLRIWPKPVDQRRKHPIPYKGRKK